LRSLIRSVGNMKYKPLKFFFFFENCSLTESVLENIQEEAVTWIIQLQDEAVKVNYLMKPFIFHMHWFQFFFYYLVNDVMLTYWLRDKGPLESCSSAGDQKALPLWDFCLSLHKICYKPSKVYIMQVLILM
jgi:hypothetical protein